MEVAGEGLASLAIAIFASCVLGVAALLIIYKMIDEEFPFLQGIVALLIDFLMIAMAIIAKSPVVPGTIFVVALASMALFPYAADQLERADLRQFGTERLIKAYNAYVDRPDNISAVFEVARGLWEHGMKGNAIGIATAALNSLSKTSDSLSNRSMRDMFRNEEYMLKNWNREAARDPSIMRPVPCPKCGHISPLEYLVCEKCQTPYLLHTADKMTVRHKVYGRLLLTFAVVSGVIVGAAAIGMMFSGFVAFLALVAVLTGAGFAIQRLFKPPTPY